MNGITVADNVALSVFLQNHVIQRNGDHGRRRCTQTVFGHELTFQHRSAGVPVGFFQYLVIQIENQVECAHLTVFTNKNRTFHVGIGVDRQCIETKTEMPVTKGIRTRCQLKIFIRITIRCIVYKFVILRDPVAGGIQCLTGIEGTGKTQGRTRGMSKYIILRINIRYNVECGGVCIIVKGGIVCADGDRCRTQISTVHIIGPCQCFRRQFPDIQGINFVVFTHFNIIFHHNVDFRRK